MTVRSYMNSGSILDNLIRKYAQNGKKPIPFDFKASSNTLLGNGTKSIKDIHYFHYYPGRIFPYIPYYLLSVIGVKDSNECLLDPFAGSGTILLESILNPVNPRNALGVEINPIGRLISKVKTTPLDTEKIEQYMSAVSLSYRNTTNIGNYLPEFKNRELWFSDNAIMKLAKLRCAIDSLDAGSDYRDFFWICFSNVIRKASKADPYIPPPVILKPEKYKENRSKYTRTKRILNNADSPDVWKQFEEVTNSNKNRLSLLNAFEDVKKKARWAEIIWDDARHVRKGKLSECGRLDKESTDDFASGSIDIVFTSPPYITAQKYIRTSKLELFWLGYSEQEIGIFEEALIGTERIRKGPTISSLGIESIDSIADYAVSLSPERAIMVFEYFRGMIESLKEIHRLLGKNSYAILVVGDNRVLERRVPTYRLLGDAAIELGFEELVILKDTIRSRSMMTKRNGTGGIIKNEYVVILKKET